MESTSEMTLVEYVRVIWRARWWILTLVLIAVVVSFSVGRLQPKYYRARATILEPRDSGLQSTASVAATILGGSSGVGGINLPGLALSLPRTATTQDMYAALLTSRLLREEVVAEFAKTWGPSVKDMIGSLDVDARQKGVITLALDARDPKLAADAANFYFQQLQDVLERFTERATKLQEMFYARQLERSAKEVETAEQAVLKFQTENRFIVPVGDGGGKSSTSADPGTSLRASIMGLEMQRELLRMRFTEQHPQMREIEKQIAELKRQYSKNLFGTAMELPPEAPTARGGRKEFFVATEKMTPLSFAFLKLYRKLQIQEAFYTAALQGLQQLKYGEGLNTPKVEILDRAIQPPTHSRPNLPWIVGIAGLAALIAGICGALVAEYVSEVREQLRLTRVPAATRSRRSPDGPNGQQTAVPGRGLTVESPGPPSLRRR